MVHHACERKFLLRSTWLPCFQFTQSYCCCCSSHLLQCLTTVNVVLYAVQGARTPYRVILAPGFPVISQLRVSWTYSDASFSMDWNLEYQNSEPGSTRLLLLEELTRAKISIIALHYTHSATRQTCNCTGTVPYM